jgi:uncharacterized protein (TIGR02145 family)/uncharacterized repeat protein (TIGR02543 family)
LIGWFTAAEGGDKVTGGTTGTKFDKNTTLYARWTIKKYTVTFDLQNHTAIARDPQIIEHGDKVTNPGNPSYVGLASGYTFQGWCKEPECDNLWDFDEDVVTSDNMILYAKWTWTCIMEVRLQLDGGTLPLNTPNPMHNVDGGTLPYLPEPEKRGYTFEGWWTGLGQNTRVTESSVLCNSGMSFVYIYAHWSWPENAPTYTVTFDANGGKFADGTTESKTRTTGEGFKLTYDDLPTLIEMRDDGYHYVGWYTEMTGGEEVTLATEFEENTIIYARWIMGLAENEFEDERDGKIYKWTQIDTQKWMAQNLDYNGINKNGSGTTIGVCYNDDDENCATYGRLYSWTEAMADATGSSANPSNVQGACPAGWHLPSDAEWTALTTAASAVENSTLLAVAARALSVEGFITNATNSTGFSARPGGYVTYLASNGAYNNSQIGSRGRWWSATEATASNATYREMYTSISSSNQPKLSKYSVRCVAD